MTEQEHDDIYVEHDHDDDTRNVEVWRSSSAYGRESPRVIEAIFEPE